jgi:hypothetical protein
MFRLSDVCNVGSTQAANAKVLLMMHCFMMILLIGVNFCSGGNFSKSPREKVGAQQHNALSPRCHSLSESGKITLHFLIVWPIINTPAHHRIFCLPHKAVAPLDMLSQEP